MNEKLGEVHVYIESSIVFLNLLWMYFVRGSEQPVFSNIPFVLLLVILPLSGVSLALKWSGLFVVLMAFHISVTLIWAIIWLTDNMLFFSSRLCVLIQSLTFTCSTVLSILLGAHVNLRRCNCSKIIIEK